MIIFVGGDAFSVSRINGPQWAVGLVLGVISVPVAIVLRLIPDEFIMKLIPTFWKWHDNKSPEVVVSDENRRFEWNPALDEIRDQLSFIKTVRGGRLRNLKHKLLHPEELLPSRSASRSRDRSSSTPATPTIGSSNSTTAATSRPASPSPEQQQQQQRTNRRRTYSRSSSFLPAAAMAGVVAGSVAGWSPVERSSHHDDDSIGFPPKSAHELFDSREGIEVHPETAQDDGLMDHYSTKIPPSQNPELFFDHRSRSRRSSYRSQSVNSER